MYPQRAVYPVALAGANAAMGLLLYRVSGPVSGGLLVAIGLLVVLVSVGSSVSERWSVRGESP